MTSQKTRVVLVGATMVAIIVTADVMGMTWVTHLFRLWLAMLARALGI